MNGNSNPMTPTDPNKRAREQRELAERIFNAAYPPTSGDTFASFGRRCIKEAMHTLSHAAAVEGEAVEVEAVGVLRKNEDGEVRIEWLLEGGASDMLDGDVLCVLSQPKLTAESGHVTLYTTPKPAPAAVAGGDADEDAYVIEHMGKLLAEIAVIVNGPEPALTRWSYHDLPEKVRALKTAPAAVPAGEAKNKWAPPYPDAAKDPFNALLTTPPAPVPAVRVTDEMVELACEAYLAEAKRQNFHPSEAWARSQQAKNWMRAALEAALGQENGS